MRMTKFQRIFGAGPRGLLVSLLLLALCFFFFEYISIAPILKSESYRIAVFSFLTLMTFTFILWSLRSLPPKFRGEHLVQHGAFAYMRHPLYGAFLTFFDFGLAIYLNDYLFIVWALLQFPIWTINVKYEEGLMLEKFGKDYQEYSKRVPRFVPIKFI